LLSAAVPAAVLKLCQTESSNQASLETNLNNFLAKADPEIELLVPTFLGNDQRRFYGRGVPKSLKLIDKFQLGSGRTFLGKRSVVWSGAGWTGQPTITRYRGKKYLIIGAYDHNLRKINIATNKEVWRYKFDDIIKGSSTIYIDEKASAENRIVIVQGSRSGGGGNNVVPSFRAISFRTGKELWKLDIRRTATAGIMTAALCTSGVAFCSMRGKMRSAIFLIVRPARQRYNKQLNSQIYCRKYSFMQQEISASTAETW
jgi:hypothetical protein